MQTKKGFQALLDDTDALYVRDLGDRRFHFIAVTDMDDACGRDNEGRPRYVAELSEVELSALSASTIKSALDCCGDDGTLGDLQIAEACHSYGTKAPLHSISLGSRTRAFAQCRAESYRLTRDANAYQAAMDRPVNRLGSTAREFMRGDLNAALARGLIAGNPSARIMVETRGLDPDETRRRVLAQDDPLAFLMGYMTGSRNGEKDDPGEDDTLAPAYLAGYEWGTLVFRGKAVCPEWIKQG